MGSGGDEPCGPFEGSGHTLFGKSQAASDGGERQPAATDCEMTHNGARRCKLGLDISVGRTPECFATRVQSAATSISASSIFGGVAGAPSSAHRTSSGRPRIRSSCAQRSRPRPGMVMPDGSAATKAATV